MAIGYWLCSFGRNARGLDLREQIERIRAQAPAAPMRPSKPALPERARLQDWAPTVENARRLGLPETTRPAANRRPSAERPANEPPALTRYLDHAGRAVNAAVNGIAEPVAMAVDLGMAGVGAALHGNHGQARRHAFHQLRQPGCRRRSHGGRFAQWHESGLWPDGQGA